MALWKTRSYQLLCLWQGSCVLNNSRAALCNPENIVYVFYTSLACKVEDNIDFSLGPKFYVQFVQVVMYLLKTID